jgi:outer membrane protein
VRWWIAGLFLFGISLTVQPILAEKPSPAPPDAGLSLLSALAITYDTNPQIAAARAGLRATDEFVAQANANWRPTINASGTYGLERYNITGTPGWLDTHPLQVQVGVQQNIFRGGRTAAEISKAKAQVRAGRTELIATEQTVLLAAATAYVDVVRDMAILRLRRQNIDVLRWQREATIHQYKAGMLTKTDVSQAEARLATAEADLAAAEGQLEISRSNFLQTIGRPAETLEDSPVLPSIVPSNPDTAVAQAIRYSPALISARENEHAADYAVNDAIGALLPQISVQGGYSYSEQNYARTIGAGSVVHGVNVMGTVTIPIYQGGAEQATVRQAKEWHAQAQLNVSVTDRRVRDAVATAWNQYNAAKVAIEANKATVAANTVAVEGVRKEQQVGNRTILDVLNAEQELLNSKVSVVASERNRTVAAFQLLAADGQLTAKNLGLEVSIYDPLEHYNSNAASWIGLGD